MKRNYIHMVMATAVLLLPACETVPPVETDKPVIIWQSADYCNRHPESILCEGGRS